MSLNCIVTHRRSFSFFKRPAVSSQKSPPEQTEPVWCERAALLPVSRQNHRLDVASSGHNDRDRFGFFPLTKVVNNTWLRSFLGPCSRPNEKKEVGCIGLGSLFRETTLQYFDYRQSAHPASFSLAAVDNVPVTWMCVLVSSAHLQRCCRKHVSFTSRENEHTEAKQTSHNAERVIRASGK